MPFAVHSTRWRSPVLRGDLAGAPPWRQAAGVIFMHHGVALDGDAWMDWQPTLLAAGYRIIRLDMRGFGRSEPTPAGYRWSLAGFFADMEAVLAAENVDAFHFVGEFIGGLIGLAYAARSTGAPALGRGSFERCLWAPRPGRGPVARHHRCARHGWMGR